MNNQMTVKQLLKLCQEEVKKGNGNKFIVVADDNEGNGYHGMFYGFSDAMEMEADLQEYGDSIENQIYDSCYTKPEEIIILG
jgi:hypothetical protein